MSYLDVPRIHFSGQFFGDVSTRNNEPANYNNGVLTPADLWNPNGTHRFSLRNCRITGVADANGALLTDAAQDRLIGGRVESTHDLARLVDLDPEHQTASQIWGLGLRITDARGESVTGTVATATLRDLWGRSPGFPDDPADPDSPGSLGGASGAYQTILTGLQWPPSGPLESPVLDRLFGASRAALSLKMVLYAYDGRSTPPNPNFRVGQVVGTIGPVTPGEPAHITADRKLVDPGSSTPPSGIPTSTAARNAAPFKLDAGRRRLVIDLGNSLPEVAPGGARQALGGPLVAQLVHRRPRRAEDLGAVPNDAVRFRQNAGIEEVALTARQAADLATRPLRLKAGSSLVLAERPAGILADVTQTAVRLNPAAPPAARVNASLPTNVVEVDVVVTQFGRLMANANVFVGPIRRPLTALSVRGPAGALSPLPAVVRTGPNGRVTLTLVAGNPGHPRPNVDGAVSILGIFVGSVSSAGLHAAIAVRVYDQHPVPASPTWADVQEILTRYARLYPAMTAIVDLSNQAAIRPMAGALRASILRDMTNPSYMPVSRDLSESKTQLLADWLARGAP